MGSQHHCNKCPYWCVTKKKYQSGFYNITICRKYRKQIFYLAGSINKTPCPCSMCEKEFSYVPYIEQWILQEVKQVAERLTVKAPSGLIHLVDNSESGMNQAIKKLAEYETAEEEGRLVVLPSNQVWKSQGDIVYYIYDYEITECVNCGISICADGKVWIGLAADEDIFPYREPIAEFDTDPTDWCKKTTDVLALEWGKTVFLTRGEAEKALKEMEGK